MKKHIKPTGQHKLFAFLVISRIMYEFTQPLHYEQDVTQALFLNRVQLFEFRIFPLDWLSYCYILIHMR